MYDQSKADRVIKFIETYCTHTAGKWAGHPFVILPWQRDVINKLYGTLRDDGYRQYRFCYLEIPKKNGKTEFGAALGLNQLCNDGELGGEVYSAAADREQAGLVYKAAKIMVENKPELKDRANLEVIDSRKRIIHPKSHSFYQVLSSETNTKHGLNPSAVLVDEIHGHPNGDLYEVLTSGTHYAREQQLVIIMTTAGIFDPESIWWRVRNHAIAVANGVIDDPTFLPVLYISEKDEDPGDEELWKRVNPSLGQIFTLDKIREEYNRVKDDPIELNSFKRFRLNIPAQSVSQWITTEQWEKCNGDIDEEKLRGRVCYSGLDLSSTTDLSALVHVFPPESESDRYQVIVRYFIPEKNIDKRVHRDRVPYDVWVDEKYITATAGAVVDYNAIIKQLSDDAEKFDIREVCFDRWGATWIINELQEMGFEDPNETKYAPERHLITFGQGYASMSAPMKETHKIIVSGRINHGNNPVLRWNANNVYAEVDAAENWKPSKGKSTDRIDGIVAMIMAMARATLDRDDITDDSLISF